MELTVLYTLHHLASFIIVITVIVFVHEFGHYFVARACGVKIDAFSIGFGKELVGHTDRHGTRWKIAALPLGGYVKMFGDASAASTPDDDSLERMSEEERKLTFHHKPLWKKALIVAAGPVANFILTIGILTYFIFTVGLPSAEPVVGALMPDTPAERAGLQVGDRILKVGDYEVSSFNDISYRLATNLGTPVELELKRGDTPMTLTITPKEIQDEDGLGNTIKRPIIGIRSQNITYEDVGLPRAVQEAGYRTYLICTSTLKVLGQMITGNRNLDDLKGPVGIAKLSGQAADKGFSTALWLIAMLSANLGLVNLLPIPLLDGGHLAYYAAEAARGKPLAVKIQEAGFRLGFVMLAALMLMTVYNDIRQLF